MEGLKDINWHDCILVAAVEIPSQNVLVLNVKYPDDWENNIFSLKGIVFEDFCSQQVNEIPFEGTPTLLGTSVQCIQEDYSVIRIETNAGYRIVKAKCVSIGSPVQIL